MINKGALIPISRQKNHLHLFRNYIVFLIYNYSSNQSNSSIEGL